MAKLMSYTCGPTSRTSRESAANHATTVSVAYAVLPASVPSFGMGTMNENGVSIPLCEL